jgi:ATP-dependent protease ClpP protease subunit
MSDKNKNIYLFDDISSCELSNLKKTLIESPEEQIFIYFDSEGGDCKGVIGACNLIAYHGNIVGVAVGKVNSAAFDIFCACQTRIGHKNSEFFVHDIHFHGLNDFSLSHLEDFANSKKQEMDRLLKYVYKNTLITSDFIKQNKNGHDKNDNGFWFDADKALELQVINKIYV